MLFAMYKVERAEGVIKMTATFTLDKATKQKLKRNSRRQSRKAVYSYGYMRQLLGDALGKNLMPPKAVDRDYPTEAGRAGLVFNALLKLGKIGRLPGYAYFTYDQSFLRYTPDHLKVEEFKPGVVNTKD